MLSVAPLYHLKVRDHFKQQRETWNFFAAAGRKEEQLVSFKTELLKNTYKFQPDTDSFIYDKIALAKERLELGDLPVTAYQAQYSMELVVAANEPFENMAHLQQLFNDGPSASAPVAPSASIIYLHGEAHLVFSGNLTQSLNEEELLAVIAHELAHVKLYSLSDGELEVTDRIINAIANNSTSEPVYQETARLFRLYTEIYCDRGAWVVLGDKTPVINMLLKIATGLAVVHAGSYSKQAEEIFSASPATRSAKLTHPENFIRTQALRLWQEKKEGAEEEITRMIEGIRELDRLDIFSQKELAALTRDFLQAYLRPKWFQSTLVTSLAKEYFPDLSLEQPALREEQLTASIAPAHPSIKEYFAYILLDFALVDPSLEENPSGRAFQFAEELQLSAVYDPIVRKELQLSEKKWPSYKQQTLAAYAGVKES